MRSLTIATLLTVAAAGTPTQASSLSSVASFISGLNLPASVQSKVQSVITRVESAIDDYELPGDHPDVDQIISDAIDRAQARAAAAKAKAQAAIDRARSRVHSILDDLDLSPITLPPFDFSDLNLPDLDDLVGDAIDRVEDFLDGLDLGSTLPSITAPNFNLPSYDLPNVDSALSDALGRAQAEIDKALAKSRGVLDDVLDSNSAVSNAIDKLPPAAIQALESVFGSSLSYNSLPVYATSTPEPSSMVGVLSAVGALLAGRRRR